MGVQNGVQVSTVLGGGWSIIYQDTYANNATSLNTVFSGAGQYVMLAAKNVNSNTFDVLAAALTSDVLTYTSF